jgi:hypothetical protein
VDPFSLCLELTPGFRAAIDGSVTRTQLHGSFGWIVSSLSGDRLATGMGPARGRSPHSFRAEVFGVLSFLRFLLRIKEYTGMHDPWVGILATDGQSVLDTLQLGNHDQHEAADTPVDLDKGDVVLDCLRPDWDLLIKIQLAIKSLPNITIQYVEGHQDKSTSYSDLDLLMGQLNVNADSQAAAYNLEFGAHRSFVLMCPKTRAHLQFPDGTVTGHYPQILQYKASTKPLLEYIRHKNEWTTSVLHSIHWEAHARAIKKSAIPHTHLVKMLHALLPKHARANKFDGGSRLCVLCGSNPTTTSYAVNITLVTLGDKHFLGIFVTSSSALTYHPSY